MTGMPWHGEEPLGDCACVHSPNPLRGDELQRSGETRLCQHLAGLERAAGRRVDPRPVRPHGEDGREHGKARGMGGRDGDTGASEAKRRLDEPGPGQPPVAAPERVEPGREPWHRAGARSDGVVDELLAERHLQLDRRRARPGGDVDEAVEQRGLAPVPVERVPAAQKARHDRLGDARSEARGDRRVRGGPTLLEDLDPGRHRVGMPGCNTAWKHEARLTTLRYHVLWRAARGA